MPESDPHQLITKYHSSGVVPDTNLLLVYLIGIHDPNLIPRFKRTKAFTADDFRILHLVLKRFTAIFTTPSILTEVNSLSNQLPENVKVSFLTTFKDQIGVFEERFTPSKEISLHAYFNRCGLTDCGIILNAQAKFLILTDDFRLCGFLDILGIDYINYNHIRAFQA